MHGDSQQVLFSVVSDLDELLVDLGGYREARAVKMSSCSSEAEAEDPVEELTREMVRALNSGEEELTGLQEEAEEKRKKAQGLGKVVILFDILSLSSGCCRFCQEEMYLC